jgi:serine/threonine-protein kinase RsbW
MSISDGRSVEVRIPSRFGFEKVAMDTVASMAKLMGFSQDRIDNLKTAVAEACINAMEHGNKMDSTIPVGVILSMNPGELEIKVLDDGQGMTTPPPNPDIDRKMSGDEDPRGMGMFLIRALVDEVEWVPNREGHSFVKLTIHLDKETE